MNSANASIPASFGEEYNCEIRPTTNIIRNQIGAIAADSNYNPTVGPYYATPTATVDLLRNGDDLSTHQIFHKDTYTHAITFDPVAQQRRLIMKHLQMEKRRLARQLQGTNPQLDNISDITSLKREYEAKLTSPIQLSSNHPYRGRFPTETSITSRNDCFYTEDWGNIRKSSSTLTSYCSPTACAPEIPHHKPSIVERLPIVSNHSNMKNHIPLNDPVVVGRCPIVVYRSVDDDFLSEYQCFARQQIEFFEASEVDVMTRAKGRNKPIILGQVGVRCRHCASIPPKYRSSAAIFYPRKLGLIYQTAQNLIKLHLHGSCPNLPESVHVTITKLNRNKCSAGSGKVYWQDSAAMSGIYETDDNCLAFRKEE